MTDQSSKHSKKYPGFNLNTNDKPVMLKTPKQVLEGLLSTIYVDMHVKGKKADVIILALHDQCIPDVVLKLYDPGNFFNPVLDIDADSIPLWTLLRQVCERADVVLDTTDKGELTIRSYTVMENLNRAKYQAEEIKKIKQIN